MRVGTYPTRDFATLGILLLLGFTGSPFSLWGKVRMGVAPHLSPLPGGEETLGAAEWTGHFCRPLHVATQIGLHLPTGSDRGLAYSL